MPRINISALGVQQVDRTLFGLRQKLGDLTEGWHEVHKELIEIERRLFESEGSTGQHGRWDRYSGEPKYAAFRARILGPTEPVLRWGSRSRLAPSLTFADHPDHVFRAGPAKMAFGTSVPYAGRLAQGGVGPFGERYGPRRAIDLRSEDATSVARALLRWIRSFRVAPGYRSDEAA